MRATDMPALRHAMASVYTSWPDNGKDDHVGARKEGLMWQIAEMYWVTSEMARVAMDAALDMPDYTMSQIIPCDVGFIVYDGGLPELPIISAYSERGSFGGAKRFPELPVDYLMWYRRGNSLFVQYGCDVATARARGFDPTYPQIPLMDAGTINFPEFLRVVVSRDDPGIGDDQTALVKVAVVTMLAATWSLMRQETVASTQRQAFQPSSNQYKKGRRPGMVTTVSLRRMRVVSDEIDQDGGRKLTHRHIVRGHWRQQACGPNNSERRPVWIPSYIKGPEGAELVMSEKVMVWRR